MKDVNIITINYHNKDETLVAVESIFNDLKESSLDFTVLVVDNSQNADGIKDALADRFPKIRYIDSGSNIGFGKANNLGFRDAPAKYYFAFNSDAVIPENSRAIERMVDFMEENEKVGIVGPKLLNFDDTLQYSCYRFNRRSLLVKPFKQINWEKKYKILNNYANELVMKDFDHNETRPVDWVLGAAMLIRHQAIEEVGWFDERYFMYLEDADWCVRMWEAGWPVYYLHCVEIKHKYGRDSAKVPGIFKALFKNRLARIHLLSWLKYMKKWRRSFKFYE